MSPLIELITAWEEFTATHKHDVTVNTFCEEYLYKTYPQHLPNDTAFNLARRIGRIAAIQRTCMRLALRDVPGIEPEWYYLLYTVNEKEEIRKTDVISINLLLEPTTGIDILNRMIDAGLLKEKQPPGDKRTRILSLTPKGKATLKKAEQQVRIVIDTIFRPHMTDVWSSLDGWLAAIDYRVGDLLAKNRPKTLEELLTLAKSPS